MNCLALDEIALLGRRGNGSRAHLAEQFAGLP